MTFIPDSEPPDRTPKWYKVKGIIQAFIEKGIQILQVEPIETTKNLGAFCVQLRTAIENLDVPVAVMRRRSRVWLVRTDM